MTMKIILSLCTLLMLASCGWKAKISCIIDEESDTLERAGESCIERPEFGLIKEF